MLETPLALLIVIFSAFVVLYYRLHVPYYRRKYCMLYMRAYGASNSDVIDDVT